MQDFLIYDAKVAVLIVVFYMFYRLLLSRETFHRVNRVVLLLTAVASFVLPLCVITMHETVTIQAVPQVSIGDVQMTMEEDPATPLWQILLPILYIIGVVATLGHTLLSVWKVMLLIRQSEQHPQPDGTIVCVTGNADVAPFSWMRYIVMNRSDYEANDAAILAHERGHIRLRHSYDVVLVDLLTALQWFNPAMWMLRQDLRAIHEYEADGAVLSQGINARQYQYLLISKATGIGGYSIANGISHSTLKNRIHMMTNKKTRSSHLLKLLALVPIIGTALVLNARTVTDYVYDEPQKKQIIKKGKKAGTIKMNNQDIEVVVTESAPNAQSEYKPTDAEQTYESSAQMSDQQIVNFIQQEITNGTSQAQIVTELMIKGVKIDQIRRVRKQFDKTSRLKEGDSTPTSVEQPNKPFDVVEQMPQFPGGPAALMEYLSKNVRYPEDAHKNGIQGRVIATFVVEKDGSITEARIARSVDNLLDAEALRVVNAMPKWTPGMQKGEPVRVKYTIPITFKLQGDAKAKTENIVLGKEHKGKDFSLIIDGKVVDVADLSGISPDNIESMKVEKAKDETSKDRLIITLKKKK